MTLEATTLEESLRSWLPRQRWFAGKHHPIVSLRVLDRRVLLEGDPGMVHVVVEVDQVTGSHAASHDPSGGTVTYQLFLGVRAELPARFDHVLIGVVDGLGAVYDATQDNDLMHEVLGWIAGNDVRGGIGFHREQGADIEVTAASVVLGGEQSNTSIVFGEQSILKIFRMLVPGVNPDLEVTRALTAAGNQHVAQVRGWIDGDLQGRETTLGLMQTFLRTGSDGWRLALTSVRDLFAEGDLHADEVGGDFAGESERLGFATADVHTTLARALPHTVADVAAMTELAQSMHSRLQTAADEVPALAERSRDIAEVFDRFGREPASLELQRVHGDFHLGQVMRTDTGWVLLDFEGEPGAPISERAALSSPLRDVAGMLRSFDYASRYLLADSDVPPQLEYRAAEWAERNRDAFCVGYAKGAGRDPREDDVVLRAFELDKAVYEVLYEARNRPEWVHIPLGSIERLLAA
jgi:maltokinase